MEGQVDNMVVGEEDGRNEGIRHNELFDLLDSISCNKFMKKRIEELLMQ